MHILCKIRSYVTKKALLEVYKVMILPLLDFGDIFYQGAIQKLLNKVESLQKRAVRTIAGLPRMSSVQGELTKYKLSMLEKRRKLHLAQTAPWMAGKVKYIDQTIGNTRSHAEGRVKLKVIHPRKNKVKRSLCTRQRTYGMTSLRASIALLSLKNLRESS